MQPDYRSIDYAKLEARARALVRKQGGLWSGSSGMCLCPAHNDRTPSLSVRIGHSALLFKCFAGCDTISVLRAIGRLGPLSYRPIAVWRACPKSDTTWLRTRVMNLWAQADILAGSPAERYLRNRAVTYRSCELRYHPRTPLGPRRNILFRPALLAGVREGPELVAVQRTFLDIGLACPARDLDNPRRTLGRPASGAVQLAAASAVLGLAEGVETALSAMILLGIPVWATLGGERLPRIAIPSIVKHLILLPDNDAPGRRAEAIARKAYAQPGRRIETIWPWHGLNDWNDVLRRGREGGLGCVRQPDGQACAAFGD